MGVTAETAADTSTAARGNSRRMSPVCSGAVRSMRRSTCLVYGPPVARIPLCDAAGSQYGFGVADVIPVFPLSHVLLPGLPLPLHIFEPRYRQLLMDVRTETSAGAFGVLALRHGAEVGCEDRK